MRNPRRNRNQAVAIFLLSLGVFIAAFAAPPIRSHLGLQIAAALGAAMGVILGVTFAVLRGQDTRRLDRMNSGEGVLARWTVTPGQWNAFVTLSRQLDAEPGASRNHVDLRPEMPAEDVEIVVSDNALRIGQDFYSLQPDASVSLDRTFVEIRQTVEAESKSFEYVFRFPLAPGAGPAARRVHAHFEGDEMDETNEE